MPEVINVVFADAYFRPPIVTFTTNASLRKSQSGSFTADAVVTAAPTTVVTSRFVAVGNDIKLATSDDGLTWTQQTSSYTGSENLHTVEHGEGTWLTSGEDLTGVAGSKIARSLDGIGWAQGTIAAASFDIAAFAWSGTVWVAISAATEIFTSPDGITWTSRTSGISSGAFSDVAWGDGQFIVVGTNFSDSSGVILTSPDGITWTRQTQPSDYTDISCVTYGASTWVIGKAVTGTGSGTQKMATSPDGVTWTKRTAFLTSSRPEAVAYGNSLFVAVGPSSNSVWTSPTGTTWTQRTLGSTVTLNGVVYGNAIWVVVGTATGPTSKLFTSPDGITWTERTSSFGTTTIQAVAFGESTARFFHANASIHATGITDLIRADAVIIGPNLKANAVIKRFESGGVRTFTANASFVYQDTADLTSDRNRHDRSEWHFGNLTADLVVHDDSTTLQQRLAELWNALAAEETTMPPRLSSFGANAALFRTQVATFLASAFMQGIPVAAAFSLDAILRAVRSASLTADSILFATHTGAFTANAIHRVLISGSFLADAELIEGVITQPGSFIADGIFVRTISSSFTADAVIEAEGGEEPEESGLLGDHTLGQHMLGTAATTGGGTGTHEFTFTANAVLFKTTTATFTADAVIQPPSITFTADAVIQRPQSGSFTANAVIPGDDGESGLLGDHVLAQHELGGE